MPRRVPRICACQKVVPAGERCACQITQERARKARHDARRPSARERGYTAEWERARADYLRQHPFCMHNRCGRPATVVHHVKPHRGDKRLFWDRSNWMPACQPCHDGPLQAQERRR